MRKGSDGRRQELGRIVRETIWKKLAEKWQIFPEHLR